MAVSYAVLTILNGHPYIYEHIIYSTINFFGHSTYHTTILFGIDTCIVQAEMQNMEIVQCKLY